MDKTVGVLGGGQLGRMLAEAANRLNVRVIFLDAADSPAKQIVAHQKHIDGSFKDTAAIEELAVESDVVTIEIEHVDTDVLKTITAYTAVEPSWRTIRIIQDKYLQKQHLQNGGIETADSFALDEPSERGLEDASQRVGLPFMLKARKEAYDGKGNYPVKTKDDFKRALVALRTATTGGLYAEKWADFKMELAVMVVKTKDAVLSFPTVETIHENSICKLVYAPARGVSMGINQKAQDLAKRTVGLFQGKGVFGVEMFLLHDDSLLVNEIAPRPHNSGHYTIEACPLSQYDAHLRAILDLPISPEDLELDTPAIMLNILGTASPDWPRRFAGEALKQRRTSIHLYGKGSQPRKGRKMGHVTVTAHTMSHAEALIQPLIDLAATGAASSGPPPAGPASASQPPPASASPPSPNPTVAVLMGSDSDLTVLRPGLDLLGALSIPFETRITSAHRTPTWMATYAASARAHGRRVLIAAAGGAAHLPGMAAAHTSLPVIGVPVRPSIGDGTDSLLSIVSMPRGVPVATVGVNNSVNAALLAARILGASDPAVAQRVEDYMRRATDEVRAKDARLVELGYSAYATKYLGAT